MSGDNEPGADVDLNLAGQKITVKNIKSVNTIATVATLICVCVGLAVGYTMFQAHAAETKDASKELVMALREMTQAAREQNCLMAFPIDKREVNAELCKRLAR